MNKYSHEPIVSDQNIIIGMKEVNLCQLTKVGPSSSGTLITNPMYWYNGFQEHKKGGLILIDKKMQKQQQGIVKEIISQLGSQLFSGKLAVSLSLPIRIFEPRSTLERVSEAWSYLPTLLRKAVSHSDPIERMKYVIAFVMGGLHFCVGQSKPFNPILGETYEASFHDGTNVYMEHISHHPPVCAFLVVGAADLFTLSGSYELSSTLKGNSIINSQVHKYSLEVGESKLVFSDGGSITYSLPELKMGGIMVGDRHVEWIGQATFKDESNKLVALASLNNTSKVFSKSIPSDEIRGKIEKFHGSESRTVSQIQGSWLHDIRFDRIKYWDITTEPVSLPNPVSKPLPSDCRFRMDLKSLKNGDMNMAQKNKSILEDHQRREKKLREGTLQH